MRLRAISFLSVGALVAGGVLASAPVGASHKPSAVGHGRVSHLATGHAGVLYSQYNNDSGVGIVSQNFEAANDVYDSNSADDFKVPKGAHWKLQEVDVAGVYFNGPGPAVSETVTIYRDGGGVPGAIVKTVTASGTDSGGSFAIAVGNIRLRGGHYWVAVQVNMDFTPSGEWGWEGRTRQTKNEAVWENPGDGFATGCTAYASMQTCIPSGEGPDHVFALRGVSS